MKTCYKIAFASLLALVAFASCRRQEAEPLDWRTKLQVVESDLVFTPVGGTGTITLNSTGVTATSDASWCQTSVSGDKVSVTVSEWGGLESRYTKVLVSKDGETVSVPVAQTGVNLGGIEIESEISLKGAAATFTYPCTANTAITATSEEGWITPVLEEDELKISVAANPDKAVRFGTVTITVGDVVKEVSVTQYPVFENTSDWVVTYEGEGTSQGKTYSVLANTVTADLGMYTFSVSTPAAFAASGLSEADYVYEMALSLAEEINEVVALYNQYGYPYTFSSFMLEGSDWDYITLLDKGDYIAYAIGFDEDGYPTGWYTADQIKVGELTPYQKWLGKWNVPRNDGTDVWIVEQKEENKSFWVSGIGGKSADTFATGAFRAEVPFDAETGQMVFTVVDNTGITWTDSSRGEMHALLSGRFVDPSDEKTYYTSKVNTVIARATLSSDGLTASLKGEKNADDATFFCILWFGRYINSSTNKWSAVSWTNGETALPATMTKAE